MLASHRTVFYISTCRRYLVARLELWSLPELWNKKNILTRRQFFFAHYSNSHFSLTRNKRVGNFKTPYFANLLLRKNGEIFHGERE